MSTLVGDDRRAIVDRLLADFDAVAAGNGPRAISLESPLGLGKTRIVQELFARLAADRQPKGPYWPEALDWHASASGDARPDLLHSRKQVEPTAGWLVRGKVEIPWLWWGISCQTTSAGSPMRTLKNAGDQLRTHLDPLTAKLARGDRRREDALTALSAMFDLVGVVNPGGALDAGSKFLGIWRRRRDESRESHRIAADRRIETNTESFEEAARLAESLAFVGRAGTPVVVVADDAHDADVGLVSLIRHLLELDGAPVLVITTAWPERLSSDPSGVASFGGWLRTASRSHPERVASTALRPLPQSALTERVLSVAPRTDPAVAQQIAATADGNPLVLNLLLDLDLVRRDIAADGRIDTDPEALGRLPSRLRTIYHDLWRQLPGSVRRVIAAAAIQGPVFLPGATAEAAIRLGLHDELVPALAAARETHHWLRAVTDERWQFAEQQRFEIVDDLVGELFTESQVAEIRATTIDHILGLKASSRWDSLDDATRRLALETHLELNEELGEGVIRDVEALADSMVQLAALEVEAGATEQASQLLNGAIGLGGPSPGAESLLAAADELSAAARSEVATSTSVSVAVEAASADELGRRPWISWQPRPIGALNDMRPSEIGDLVAESVAVEGPVCAGRVHEVLMGASGATRQGRLIRSALERGVLSAIRRRLVLASAPDARGHAERRLLWARGQTEVVLRVPGPRPPSQVPATEIAELGRRVLQREPALTRVELKARLASLLGEPSLGRALDALLEAALPASFGEAAAAADEWGRLPWVGWHGRPLHPLVELRPAELAAILGEVVAAEGPVTVGRAFDLIFGAAGTVRRTAALTNALDGGLAAALRRDTVVAARGRHGHPETRILRLPEQPEVVLRQPGDRDPFSLPHSEIAELARRVSARTAAATRDDIKREVAQLLGASRYTAALGQWLEFAVPGDLAT